MSIALPDILSGVASVLTAPAESQRIYNPDPAGSKPIVLCITRDIPEEDMRILMNFGVVKTYDHNIHANIDPSTMPFKYFIIDLRKPSARLYFQLYVLPLGLQYHRVLYKWSWEDDLGIPFESQLTDFPPNQATERAYDQLLLSSPIQSPSCLKAFLVKLAICGAK